MQFIKEPIGEYLLTPRILRWRCFELFRFEEIEICNCKGVHYTKIQALNFSGNNRLGEPFTIILISG